MDLPIPKISIVTPSLNQGRFIQQCIDSVQAQEWPFFEHIVIDGGSEDETCQLLELNRNKLHFAVSEPDMGAADAINKGLRKCTGDIVAWLNADDFYMPKTFERVAEAWRENPNASFWFGNGVRVNEEGDVKAVFNPGDVIFDECSLTEGLDYILQPSTFINAKALGVTGLLDTELRWSFDWDLWIRLAKVSLPFPINERLSATREWASTLTASGGFSRAEELRLLAERYTGKSLTRGAACYYLGAFMEVIGSQPNYFDEHLVKMLSKLRQGFQRDLGRLNVDTLGMPVKLGDSKTPMVLGIDLYPLISGVSGGIVPWVNGVLREMVRLYPMDQVYLFHRPGPPPVQIFGDNVMFIPLHDHPDLFYKEMGENCDKLSIEALVRTYPQERHPDFPATRQVTIIPDIQHEYFPEFFPKEALASRRRAFGAALSGGGAIATMTNHSRETIASNAWTTTDDVFLMPAALPEELQKTPELSDLPSAAAEFSYFFYMPANLWPHKNHRRLFEAFKLALPNLPEKTGLILTGNPDGWKEIIDGFDELPIVHLGFLPHMQVTSLFSHATALVYFSLFEGFGMPLLEAFHHGTPVLCSNTTSLPEVGGDAVLSCDPTDVSAMSTLMLRIVWEQGLRENLSAKAKQRLAIYDWKKPAHSLRAALKRVSENPIKFGDSKPLISIVMPTRNQGQFIRESIDSVLNQSYDNFEFIVIDGASTDNTLEILRSYGERIRWISEPDKGQTDAINKGMELIEGEILAYLNSDDILLPDALEKVAAYFNEHPDCDMVYGKADYIDIDGAVIGPYNTSDYSFGRLMQDCCICQPAAFWRRRVAERVGSFDSSLQTAMDYEYWLRMATTGANICHLRSNLAQSRLHDNAKTLSMRGEIFREIFNITKKHGGYVSLNYFQGLWHYRMNEKKSIWRRPMQLLPRAYLVPALLGFMWQLWEFRSDKDRTRYVLRIGFDVVDRHYPYAGKIIRRLRLRYLNLKRRFL